MEPFTVREEKGVLKVRIPKIGLNRSINRNCTVIHEEDSVMSLQEVLGEELLECTTVRVFLLKENSTGRTPRRVGGRILILLFRTISLCFSGQTSLL